MGIKITKCPYCGNDGEYYTRDFVYGNAYYNYRFDNEEADNEEFYSCLVHELGKYAYCSKCHKRLSKMEAESE